MKKKTFTKAISVLLISEFFIWQTSEVSLAGTESNVRHMSENSFKAESQASSAPRQDSFSKRLYGPGVDNLSASDPLAQYQWGLRNDGELQYLEIINRFKYSDPDLAFQIDMSNQLGEEPPIAGPDAYRIETTTSIKGIDINIQPAWELYDASTGEHREVIVAVLDTGIDISHPEIKDAIWINEDEIPGDGIDNDHNGYIDDVNGWNFFHHSNQVFVGEEDDHGTHSAGTIAAMRKGQGIAGIADQKYVKIMPIKVLGTEDGMGEEAAIINAILYAQMNGASICNLSLGTLDYYPNLEMVMKACDMLFVVSAGNGDHEGNGINVDVTPDYPSSFHLPNVISVANLMFDGNLEKSSNYGVNTVDIAAPGTYIVSTAANNSYGYMTGTSMATPMVTGVAAMLYSYRKDIALEDIKPILMAAARKLPGLQDKVTCGGMVDAYAALTYIKKE